MFLTKKARIKSIIIGLLYLVLGLVIHFIASVFSIFDGNKLLLVLALICYVLFPVSIHCTAWSEGNKILSRATKLVYNELKPEQFIKEYNELRSLPNLVVNKPSQDVLRLVADAYYLMDERVKCLETYDEMIATAREKKRPYAKLLKAGTMYEYGMADEAEELFLETQKNKLTLVQVGLTNNIIKHERAMVRGDYKIAEGSKLEIIGRDFPKPTNSDLLVCHYRLAKIYMEMGEVDLAISHLDYCAKFGGKTAIRTEASKKLCEIQEK